MATKCNLSDHDGFCYTHKTFACGQPKMTEAPLTATEIRARQREQEYKADYKWWTEADSIGEVKVINPTQVFNAEYEIKAHECLRTQFERAKKNAEIAAYKKLVLDYLNGKHGLMPIPKELDSCGLTPSAKTPPASKGAPVPTPAQRESYASLMSKRKSAKSSGSSGSKRTPSNTSSVRSAIVSLGKKLYLNQTYLPSSLPLIGPLESLKKTSSSSKR